MSVRHDKWISVRSCRCGDGRSVRLKLTVYFTRPCPVDEAEARARVMAAAAEHEMTRARTADSVLGKEAELARRLARRADPAHEVASVELALSADWRTTSRGFPAVRQPDRDGESVRPAPPPRPRREGAVTGSQLADPGPSERGADPRGRIFVVHADLRSLTQVIALLGDEFYVLTATTVRQGATTLATASFDLVLANHELPDGSGILLLKEALTRNPDIVCMALSGRAAYSDVMQAMRDHALPPRVIIEPLDPPDLVLKARSVMTLARMREAASQLHKRRDSDL